MDYRGAKESITQAVIRNVFNLLGVGIIVALFLTKFSTIQHNEVDTITFIGDVALMFFFIISMYANYYNFGKTKGKTDTNYLESYQSFENVVKAVQNRKSTYGLKDFCQKFIQDELDSRRLRHLISAGIELEKYNLEYVAMTARDIRKSELAPKVKRTLLRTLREKPVRLTAEMLLGEQEYGKRFSLGLSERAKTGRDMLKKSFTFTATSLFLGYYSFELLGSPSLATLSEFAVQCVSVGTSGVFGYFAGLNSIVGNLQSRYRLKHDLLTMYLEKSA